ncbi:hypothetical protein CERSUDRAFT_91829 [Gelatoporia subvermispora B]|uniref:Uncharacterized protein n=1 Tax=Ceriporiopsis subvermispora (strain B) TaxID=914234 RepID=M2QVD4_CERS8|nr:hypothetical protein CERSUDRAFT_91829 [Gelatoporia subvermispora B]
MESVRSVLSSVNLLTTSPEEPGNEHLVGFVGRDKDSEHKMLARFKLDDNSQDTFTFVCNIAESVPFFQCDSAILPTRNVEDVTGSRAFTGVVGPTEVSFILDDGLEISGKLKTPLDDVTEVTGVGVWVKMA